MERKVAQLHGSGLSATQLRLGARAVLAQRLPLRDAPVLREAKRYAQMADPAAESAWASATARIRSAVPESTFKIWFEPISLLGGEGTTLHLIAHPGIHAWVERRYSSLISEALRQTGSGYTDVEFVSAGGTQ